MDLSNSSFPAEGVCYDVSNKARLTFYSSVKDLRAKAFTRGLKGCGLMESKGFPVDFIPFTPGDSKNLKVSIVSEALKEGVEV